MMHPQMFGLADGTAEQLVDIKNNVEKSEIKRKYDYIKWWDNCIKSGEAILVCNFDKKEIKNYIGGNSFLEIGFAYILGKKIFILNSIPEMFYKAEIIGMEPIILDGDLTKVQ